MDACYALMNVGYAHTIKTLAAPGFCLVTTLGTLHFFKKNRPAEMSGYRPADYTYIHSYMMKKLVLVT